MEGKFQPAIENPILVLASYDLLRSLLVLDTTFITQYSQSLMTYFNNTLTQEKPSMNLLRSLRELCTGNKALETLT